MAKRTKPNTEGGEVGKPIGAPMAAPGAAVQEQPGGGVDGDAGVSAGETPGAASSLPPDGAAPSDHPPQVDGAVPTADAADLATAVATIAAGEGGDAGASAGTKMDAGSDRVSATASEVISLVSRSGASTKGGHMIKVTGPKRGRRRIGRAFGAEPVLIPMEDLSQDEVAALDADPTLTIEVVPAD